MLCPFALEFPMDIRQENDLQGLFRFKKSKVDLIVIKRGAYLAGAREKKREKQSDEGGSRTICLEKFIRWDGAFKGSTALPR